MAEKKIGDLVIGLIVALFIIGGLGTIIISFDKQTTNNDNVGVNLMSIYNSSDSQYKDTEVNVYQQTFNTSTFNIPTGTDTDPRGTAQVITLARDSPGTIQNFVNTAGEFMSLHKLIISLIISSVVVVAGILVFRFLRPGGA